MKKINLSPRAKKTLIATGSALVCVGAVALIVTFSSGAAPAAVQPEPASSAATSVDMVVGDISAAPAVGGQSDPGAFVPSNGASQTTELTEISKPTSAPPPPVVEGAASTASNGTVTPPTNSALTDHTKKPTYTSRPTVTASSTPSKPASSKAPTTSSTTPKNGDVKNGKTYVDGWGWVDGTGAGGQGTVVGGDIDWGTGSQVGIMN